MNALYLYISEKQRGHLVEFSLDKRRRDILLVSVLTLIALATRLYGIWDWPISGDEHYTVAHAEERAWRFLNSAYYVLVLASTSVFGTSEWSARLPSVILGTLSIPAFYLMCRSMLNRPAALLGCVLLILHGWHLYHSQIARFYSGVVLFAILAYFLYYEALRRDSYVLLGGTLFAGLVTIMFNPTAVMVPAACAAFSLFLIFLPADKDLEYSRRVAKAHVAIFIAGALITLPAFLGVYMRWESDVSGFNFASFGILLSVMNRIDVVIAISALAGLIYLYQSHKLKASFFVITIGLPILFVYLAAVFMPPVRARYIIYILPLLIALSSYLCVMGATLLPKYRFANHALAALVIAGLLPSFISHYTGTHSLHIGHPVTFVQDNYEPGDLVVTFGPSVRPIFAEEYQEHVVVVRGKSLWRDMLEPMEDADNGIWVIVDTYRTAGVPTDLEAWLMQNASLVWRQNETRYDYPMMGYEIWVVRGELYSKIVDGHR